MRAPSNKFVIALTGKVIKYSGKSLNCTTADIKNFFGIVLLIGCLNFQQIRMYLSGVTHVPYIAIAMPRDRFFKIRSNLKVIDDDTVSTSSKEADRLWKARSLVEKVRQTCLSLHRKCQLPQRNTQRNRWTAVIGSPPKQGCRIIHHYTSSMLTVFVITVLAYIYVLR